MIMLNGNNWELASSQWKWIIISGIVGIGLGDFFLFIAMERIGPRRTGVLFAINAPLAAFLAWLILNEELTFLIIFAIVIGFLGIALAVVYGSPKTNIHDWEVTKPPLWLGVSAGLLAALGQGSWRVIFTPSHGAGGRPIANESDTGCCSRSVLMGNVNFRKG